MAFEDVAQVGGGVDLEGLRLGIKVFFTRGKQHVAAGGFQALGIGIQGAGVAVEVLVRGKLQAVDKNTGHRHVTQCSGLLHQGDVAVVQVAHGGHKRGFSKALQGVAQVGDGVDDVHGQLESLSLLLPWLSFEGLVQQVTRRVARCPGRSGP